MNKHCCTRVPREPNEYVNSSISKESPFSLAFICGTVLLKQIHRVRYDARRITIKCVRSFFIGLSVSSTLLLPFVSALSLSNFTNRYMIRAYHVSSESLGYSSLCIRANGVRRWCLANGAAFDFMRDKSKYTQTQKERQAINFLLILLPKYNEIIYNWHFERWKLSTVLCCWVFCMSYVCMCVHFVCCFFSLAKCRTVVSCAYLCVAYYKHQY